ncbi:MAG TPA: hypothetical protein VGP99_13785 [Tepidisphaeraceae bacterium]|nr:hypothetical protein [Tepidisphaeraceae bacterium]
MLDIGWLFAILLVGLIAVRIIFRQMRRHAARAGSQSFDFDLAELQKLVENGQMTEEEFRRARDVILSRTDAKFEPVKGFPVLGPAEQGKREGKE